MSELKDLCSKLSEKDLEVRGTLVKGLSAKDVKIIDVFEASVSRAYLAAQLGIKLIICHRSTSG